MKRARWEDRWQYAILEDLKKMRRKMDELRKSLNGMRKKMEMLKERELKAVEGEQNFI
jgi:DNA-binding HxlR family transcriptional regulator